jgi:hypothetical protein
MSASGVQYAVCSMRCAVCGVQYAVCSVKCEAVTICAAHVRYVYYSIHHTAKSNKPQAPP